MKKIIILLMISLSLSLVACETDNSSTKGENKTSLEVINELKKIGEAKELPNLAILQNDEYGRETISRFLSDMNQTEAFDTTGLIDAAVLTPFMNVDARSILVVRFDDSVDSAEIKEAMKNFANHLICVHIQEYEITNVGNYYIFSGLSSNDEIIETFENMSFERAEDITSETSIDVLVAKLMEETDSAYFRGVRLFDNEMTLNELKYTLSSDGTIELEGVEEAFLMFDTDTQEVIFIMKGELTDELRQSVADLDNVFVNMYLSEEPLEDSQVVENGNYIIFANTANTDAVIEAFKNLDIN